MRDGQSLARGSVDIMTPLDKIQVNNFTRFTARKLMDGMTQTWTQPPPGRDVATDTPPDNKTTPDGKTTTPDKPAEKDPPTKTYNNVPRLRIPGQ